MEAERRSTVSSLKGQLSNVEGSVKSMKAAVVFGSVLTVACLAAVFGVTILANEVSKEVKVSNNTLTTKSGESVLTTSKVVTKKIELGAVSVMSEDFVAKVNAQVASGATLTTICDDLVIVQANGNIESITVTAGSVLEAVLESDNVEARSMNWGKVGRGVKAAVKSLTSIQETAEYYAKKGARWAAGVAGHYGWEWATGDGEPAPAGGCRRRNLLMMCSN